jgi:hypothetical protein
MARTGVKHTRVDSNGKMCTSLFLCLLQGKFALINRVESALMLDSFCNIKKSSTCHTIHFHLHECSI